MKLYKLEALRGFAAFYVLLHHAVPAKSVNLFGYNFGFVFRFGQEAVILFFLLSGFVINYSHNLSKDKSFRTYFSKRFFRIYIPLIFIFAASYFLAAYQAGALIDPRLKELILNILMLQDWDAVKPNVIVQPYMENTPLWSLSYEWWFYMIYFPVYTYINENHRDLVVFVIVFLATCAYTVLPIFPFRILSYLAIWWAGVYLSNLYLNNKLYKLKHFTLPITTLTLCTAVLIINAIMQKMDGAKLLLGLHPVLEVRHFAFALIVVAGSIVWKRFKWVGFDVAFKPFLILAPISYALYISHIPLMVDAEYLSKIQSTPARWTLYILILLAFSYLVEIVIYRNFIKKLRKPKHSRN